MESGPNSMESSSLSTNLLYNNSNNNFIDRSTFKMRFNLDQLIPASGAAAVCSNHN